MTAPEKPPMGRPFDNQILSRWSTWITRPGHVTITALPRNNNHAQHTNYYELNDGNARYFLKESPLSLRKSPNHSNKAAVYAAEHGVQTMLPKKSNAGHLAEQDADLVYELYDYYQVSINRPSDYINDIQTAKAIGHQIALMHTIPKPSIPCYLSINRPLFTDDFFKKLRRNAAGLNLNNSVSTALSFVENDLLPYLSYIEQGFTHGDLHPGNILFEGDAGPCLIDWELSGITYDLFDCAFLTGCIGMDDPSNLFSPWIEHLLSTVSGNTNLTPLSCAKFYEVVVATRLLWLDLWCRENDEEMMSLENAFLKILLKEKESLKKNWRARLSPRIEQKTRWVIQDAVFDGETKQIKKHIIDCDIRTIDALKNVFPGCEDACAEIIRSLIIAFGKDNDITRIIDMIRIHEELSDINSRDESILSELAFTYANASLDFSRHHQVQAIETLVAKMDVLQKKSPPSELPIAFSYILRNYSITLSELKYHEASFAVIEALRGLSERNGDISIREELARALSSGVITALQIKDKHKLEAFFQELKQLHAQHPDSTKINGAYKFAENNMKK